ncbi:MAG TPA: GDSL-type esterase/lipase family protein [Sphingomicrobium sp.]|nr:GDSL-type esterase/lipase family protein [Sphingomicrobium sp.]
MAITATIAACAGPVPQQARPAPEPAALSADAPFRDEILRFAETDQATPPPKCPVLFVGSSSIRMWTTLAHDMAPLPVLNRGFGGSTISDVNRYFDRVVTRYRPRAIVFYAGENDIDSGQPPAHVADQFRRFLDMKWARLGDVPVFYISAKPSKARAAQLPRQSELNARIRALAASRTDLKFIDVVSAMLSGGRPRDIYVEDGLHMNAAGYAIWRDHIARALLEGNVAEARCPH